MTEEIFNLNFSRWEIIVLSLLPAVINLIIFLDTSLFLPQNETTRSFSIFVFVLGLWQISEGLVKICQTFEAGLVWYRISGIFILFVLTTGIYFILDYTKWRKRVPANLLFFLIYFPHIVCMFFMVAGLNEVTIKYSTKWYWVVNPVPSFFTGFIYLWISIAALLMVTLLLLHLWDVRTSEVKRKKAMFLLIGLSVPVIGGIIAEVLIPFILEKDNVPITNSLLTVFSFSTLIAIRKFKIFEYSPNYLWGRIKDSMSEGVIIVDNNENVVFANRVFCKLVGYRFDEIENRNIKEFIFTPRESGEAKIGGLGEIQVTAVNGVKIWVLVSASPYLDENGNTIGTIILLANITERVELEEKLKASNHELKTFIYRSSHDLRTPLTSVLGLIELANIEITDPKAHEYLGYIEGLTKKMDHMQLTLIHVMSLRDHTLKIEAVDVSELLDQIVKSLKDTEGYDSIDFHIENQLSEPIQTDRMLLRSILFNLIENGIMYRNRGLSKAQITIRLTKDTKRILMEVIDNGIGIKEEVQAKIFDMFFKATNLSIGSGLGLYLVKTSVERLEGSVLVESKGREGTKFIVVLPLH